MPVLGLRQLFDVARMTRPASTPGPGTGPTSGPKSGPATDLPADGPQPLEMPEVDAPALAPTGAGVSLESARELMRGDAWSQAFPSPAGLPGASQGRAFSAEEVARLRAEAFHHSLEDSQPEWAAAASAAQPADPVVRIPYSFHVSAYDPVFHPDSETEVQARQQEPQWESGPATHSRSCNPHKSWECLIGFKPEPPAQWPARNRIEELVRTKDQGDLAYFTAQLRSLNLNPVDVAHARFILQRQIGHDEL